MLLENVRNGLLGFNILLNLRFALCERGNPRKQRLRLRLITLNSIIDATARRVQVVSIYLESCGFCEERLLG